MIIILAAKYKTINTYGFSFGKYKNKYHYYKDNVKQDYGHRWRRELDIFKILIRTKMLFNKTFIRNNNIKQLSISKKNNIVNDTNLKLKELHNFINDL